jgi:ABC-type molybdate transport system permease subunit
MLPGEGEATRPAPVTMNVRMPEAAPRIVAAIIFGFISTYGK